jgi:hypothetical protein
VLRLEPLEGRVVPTTVVLGTSKDNTLYQSTAGNISNGAGSYFLAGVTGSMGGSNTLRGLIAFDIAGNIPAGSTINSVKLSLHVSQSRPGSQSIELHALSADWGEGTSNADGSPGQGATATTNDATWVYRFYNTDSWTSAGGDYSSTASASTSVGGTGFYTWGSTSQMVTDVQDWLDDSSSNFGWIVLGNESATSSAKRFDSKENATDADRPALTIDYTSGATASALALSDFPSAVTAGAAQTLTVTAQDASGNTVTGYRGTVHFTSSDPLATAGSGLPPDYTFTSTDAGTHTFSSGVTLKTAATQSITATDSADGTVTGSQSGITVSAAAADHLSVTGPSSVASGTAFDLTVTVRDAYDNVVTGYTGTVTFSSSDSAPTLPPDYTFTADDAGTHTFSSGVVLSDVNDMATVTATDTLDSTIHGTLTLSVQ